MRQLFPAAWGCQLGSPNLILGTGKVKLHKLVSLVSQAASQCPTGHGRWPEPWAMEGPSVAVLCDETGTYLLQAGPWQYLRVTPNGCWKNPPKR